MSARALLTLAKDGDDTTIYEHIHAHADNSALLCNLLRALSAAAEETPDRAATARRIWPNVVRHVLELDQSGHTPFQDAYYGDFFGDMTLAALIPNPTGGIPYLYREVDDTPIRWWDPLDLVSEVEAWLVPAAGSAMCVNQLLGFVSTLGPDDQVRLGLPWVAKLVVADPTRIASGAYAPLTAWLIEMQPVAANTGLLTTWQRVVDDLVVAGVTRLAPYSD